MWDVTHTTKDFTAVSDKVSRDKMSSLVHRCASRLPETHEGIEVLSWLPLKVRHTRHCNMLFKGVLIAPGDYTWKQACVCMCACVPAIESKKSVGVCLCSSMCVFLTLLLCALDLCVSMHMDVFPFCSCLLFLAERSQMRKAGKCK